MSKFTEAQLETENKNKIAFGHNYWKLILREGLLLHGSFYDFL